MRSMKLIGAGVTAAAIVSLAGGVTGAASGVIITAKSTSGGTTSTHQVELDANHARMEGDNGQFVIFDGTKQVLDLVNTEQKTYRELTKEEVDRLGQQMSGAMAQMQAQMANLPPAQRAQIEAMMKGRGANPAAAAAPKPEYRKVGTDKVARWTCDRYDEYRNGQKTAEVCTVSPSALGLSDSDFAVTRQMQAFFSTLLKLAPGAQAGRLITLGSLTSEGFSGIPVRRTELGPDARTMELSDITRGNVPETAFQVPAGFQKQPFMGGRGR